MHIVPINDSFLKFKCVDCTQACMHPKLSQIHTSHGKRLFYPCQHTWMCGISTRPCKPKNTWTQLHKHIKKQKYRINLGRTSRYYISPLFIRISSLKFTRTVVRTFVSCLAPYPRWPSQSDGSFKELLISGIYLFLSCLTCLSNIWIGHSL